MEQIDNPPRIGKCDYCGRPSVRLLNAPLMRISTRDTRPYEVRDNMVWFKSCVAPASLYEVVEDHDYYLIVLAAEAVSTRKYCFRCFDGHVSPSERDYCINLPREIKFTEGHPWWPAKWISFGRELRRITLKA